MSKALEIASERYAKGEITKEEFEEIKSSLGQTEEPSSSTITPPPEAPQPKVEAAPASEQVHAPEWLSTAIVIGGIYLLACVGVAILYPKSASYDAVMRGCGSNSAMCQCLAKSFTDQRTFLLGPFQMFAIGIDKNVGSHCARQ